MDADKTDKKADCMTGKGAGKRTGKKTSVLVLILADVFSLMAAAQPAPVYAYTAAEYTAAPCSACSFTDSEYSLYAEPPPGSGEVEKQNDGTAEDQHEEQHGGIADDPPADQPGICFDAARQESGDQTSSANPEIQAGPVSEDISAGSKEAEAGEASQTDDPRTSDMKTDALLKSSQNSQTATLVIACRVKGSLGDTSKIFRYSLTLGGLEPGAEYPLKGKKYEAVRDSADNSFTADTAGSALLQLGISSGGFIEISGLPAASSFAITQQANDHEAHFCAVETKACIASADGPPHEDLETGEIIMNRTSIYTVDFTNSRELAPLTGIAHHHPAIPLFAFAFVIFLLLRNAWKKMRIS
ncbi:MAG: hypothetical protein IJH95_08630 [Mogibacterium sp.]|nr:hypothetical protein [Mogibacterium sp.]